MSQPSGSVEGLRTLVTGASGFIGRALVTDLLARGADVHTLSRRPVGGGSWHEADIRDVDAVGAVVSRVEPDVIFHAAGSVRGDRSIEAVARTFAVNTLGTVNLLLAAASAGSPRVILAGSMEEPPTGAAEPPLHPYAASKAAASLYARMFAALCELPSVILRIFLVYGPGSDHHDVQLVPSVVRAMLTGHSPRLASGDRRIDLIYVDDVVRAFVCAATQGKPGAIVDVGSGELHSVRQVVSRIAVLVGPGAPEPCFGELRDRPGEHSRVADLDQARALLGWEPQIGLDDGLRRTVEWFARHTPDDDRDGRLRPR